MNRVFIFICLVGALSSTAWGFDRQAIREFKKALRTSELRTLAGSICASDRIPSGGEIYKSRQSPHIPNGDSRKNSTAFIIANGTRAPAVNCIYAYDASGRIVHRLGVYRRGEAEYSARFYGGSGCGDKKTPGQVAALAQKNSGYPTIFLAVGGGTCVRIVDPRQCYNSIGC